LQREEEADAEAERDRGEEDETFPVTIEDPFLEDDFDTATTEVWMSGQ